MSLKSNQIIFIGIRSSEDYYEQPDGVVRVYGKGHLGGRFLRGSMCAEGISCERRWDRWVLWGTGTASGYPGLIERFHRGYVDYLSRQFVPRWDSPNCEGELVTAHTASLLVALVDVAA